MRAVGSPRAEADAPGDQGTLRLRCRRGGISVRELYGDGCGRSPKSHNGAARICLIL